VRAYRARPARVEADRYATGEGRVDEVARAGAVRRWGWRVYGSKQAAEQWSLAQAVWAYRRAYRGERSVGRRTGRPLSLTPMDVQRDDQATGLMRLVSIAVRVLTLLEWVVRRRLPAEGTQRHGLSAGHAPRATARPTAARLVEACSEMTRTIIQEPQQTLGPLSALSPLQQRILDLLGFSSALYTRLCTVSAEPP
jgi:transposase